MRITPNKLLAVLGSVALMVSTASAQDGGLLELLLRKGLISDQEAEDVRADMGAFQKVEAPTPTTTKLRLTGDVRVRYQYDNEVTNSSPAATGAHNDRSRYRYRFRFGVLGALSDNWSAGFRLETANGATSTNADFGASGSTNFAKDGDTPFVGQVFLQYTENHFLGWADKADFRIGKHAHPFLVEGVNGFLIDTDINFEGLSEELTFNEILPGWSAAFRGGQYLLSANSRTTDRNGAFINHPSVLWMGQLEFFSGIDVKTSKWRIAPMFVTATSPDIYPAGNAGLSSDTANYENLFFVAVPVEYNTRFAGKPLALYGTYGYNFEGASRANRFYAGTGTNPASYSQLFNAGFRLGQSKNKRDWQLTGEYRYVEPGAYTSILLDSDFNAGRTNGTGFIVSGIYNLSDAVTFTTTFFKAENIDENSPAAVGFHKDDVLQVDLSAKF